MCYFFWQFLFLSFFFIYLFIYLYRSIWFCRKVFNWLDGAAQCSKLTFGSGLPQEHAVGLKFTGPSPKLLITLIIFKFFRTDPQGVLHVFRYLGILYKTHRTFCFPFLQTTICIYPTGTSMFFGRSRWLRCCVNFFTIWWLLVSSKERVQCALQLFLFRHTLAHVLIHHWKENS